MDRNLSKTGRRYARLRRILVETKVRKRSGKKKYHPYSWMLSPLYFIVTFA